MKTKILELIDSKIEGLGIRDYGDRSEIELMELRSEIEKMEDETIKTIDEMIEEYRNTRDTTDDYDIGKKCHLGIDALEELKSRLSLNQK